MSFKKLKVGDKVFVVHLRCRYDRQNKIPAKTEWLEIKKMGRKYGYIEQYCQLQKFHLSDGKSHDSSGCSRVNGYGFDVYESEEAYHKERFELNELARLKKRLVRNSFGDLTDLPAQAVTAIHDVLDKHCTTEVE